MHCYRRMQRQGMATTQMRALHPKALLRAGWTSRDGNSSSRGSWLMQRTLGVGWSMQQRTRWVLGA